MHEQVATEIFFLGSGGGRHCMTTQMRATAGFRVHSNLNIHVDPGPGALVRSFDNNLNPRNLDVIIVTHAHPDHCNDVNVLIEAMTQGASVRRGYVLASESVVNGIEDRFPVITKYHAGLCNVFSLKEGESIEIKDIKFEATKCKHEDPTTIGIKIYLKDVILGYTSDTEYFPELASQFSNVDVLIINVMRPNARRIKFHLCTEDVIKILSEIKPKLVIIQHFGLAMLRANPEREARIIEEKTRVRTMAAKDRMQIKLANFLMQSAQKSLFDFNSEGNLKIE